MTSRPVRFAYRKVSLIRKSFKKNPLINGSVGQPGGSQELNLSRVAPILLLRMVYKEGFKPSKKTFVAANILLLGLSIVSLI